MKISDKKRLDFLIANPHFKIVKSEKFNKYFIKSDTDRVTDYFENARDAIDAEILAYRRYVTPPHLFKGAWTVTITRGKGPTAPVEDIIGFSNRTAAWAGYRQIKK